MAKIEITRTAPFELLNHEDLADMPSGTNPDHDARYQLILPIGTVLMYDGTGIANVGTRTEDIGDDVADTITFSGWKVCNGNALTPNLFNRFIRCEIASGNVGGNDAMAHTHTTPNHTHTNNFTVDNHTLTIAEMPTHYHRTPESGYKAFFDPVGAYIKALNGKTDSSDVGSDSVGGDAAHNHGISGGVTLSGSGTTGIASNTENRPAYYSLIFIIRMS